MSDRRIVVSSPDEVARLYQNFQSKRCADEIADIQSHPVDGVRFVTVTTRQVENGETLLVFEFDVKKYDAFFTVLLPKKFPFTPPVVSFEYKTIPDHPDIDAETGRVGGFWSEAGKWTREKTIRDLCEAIMTMLADAKTPEASPVSKQNENEEQIRFGTNWKEFLYLCGGSGTACVNGLRQRYNCVIKFHGKKNRQELPCLVITSKMKATRDAVAVALDNFLVRGGIRRIAKFKGVDPEPDAGAFVSFFKRPSITVPEGQDLINFDGDNEFSLGDGSGDNGTRQGSGVMNRGATGGARYKHDGVDVTEMLAGGGIGQQEKGNGRDKMGKLPARNVGVTSTSGCSMSSYILYRIPHYGKEMVAIVEKTVFVQEYSDDEMVQLVNGAKEAVEHIASTEYACMDRLLIGSKFVSLKLQKLGLQLDGLFCLNDDYRSVSAVHRREIVDHAERVRAIRGRSNRFFCPVCMQRLVETRLDCGHGLCRICAGKGNQCLRCRKKVKSTLNLFY